MAQISVRVDDAVKHEAEQTFDEIGLSMNTAITIFLKACAREKRIPFELTADPFYSSANQRYLEGIMRDVRSGKRMKRICVCSTGTSRTACGRGRATTIRVSSIG